MSVIVEKPYRFVPPHRGSGWPSWIQRLRLVDWYLKRKEGIVGYECRNLDRLSASLARGDAVLLAPNHCRYADPLVLGWPAREAKTHVYAMASWHLFNRHGFDTFAIRKMGAFSIFREGQDRQSLETAIDILANAERPLILFPEGTTNRTNDRLQPLLEGITFIARNAARRRKKQSGGRVVVHPVGIKYVFEGDIQEWADAALTPMESRLGWYPDLTIPLLQRVKRLGEGLLTLKEIEYTGVSHAGPVQSRRDALIETVLQPIEQHYAIRKSDQPVLIRVRTVRSTLLPILLDANTTPPEKARVKRELEAAELAQKLGSYVRGYLSEVPVTDTRVMETIQRFEEDFLGKASSPYPLRAIISFDESIEVPAERAPRGETDPLLLAIEARLKGLLSDLQMEARPLNV